MKFTLRTAAWPVLVISTLLFIASIPYGAGTLSRLSSDQGFTISKSESADVSNVVADKFGKSKIDATILFASRDGLKVSDPAYAGEVEKKLSKLERVSSLQSYYTTHAPQFVSRDQTKTYAVVTLTGDKNQKYAALDKFRQNLPAGDLTVTLGGTIVATHEAMTQVEHDLRQAELISLPILAIVLLFVFRSVVAALLPFILGLFAIVGGISVLRVLTQFTEIDQYSMNVITLLGLGLAVDYSLLMVGRFREELTAGHDQLTATRTTLRTAGRTIFYSGLTVIVSLVSLAIFPITLLRSIGLGGAAAIVIALLAALVILPALLVLLGSNINRWRVPFSSKHLVPQAKNIWGRLAHAIIRRPILYLLFALVVVLTLALPLKNIHFISQDYHALAAGSNARLSAESINNDFAGQKPPITVLLTRPQLTSAAGLQALVSKSHQIAQVSGVSAVTSLESPLARQQFIKGDTAQLTVNYTAGGPSDATAQNIVKQIRALRQDGFKIQVGGAPAEQYDLVATILHYSPYAAGVIVLTILIVLSLLLKSFVLPIQAVVINSFSLLAALGIVVWIFQQGHLTSHTWLTYTGGLDVTTPVLIFAISFGLSMDYAVFLYSRIHESHDKTANTPEAIVSGVELTGPIITEAAALFFIVVIAFASSQIPTLQQIGLGMGLAVIIDAFFVRIVVVPAVMKLAGRLNWIYLKKPVRKRPATAVDLGI